jgi:hypothetical protein
MLQKSKNLKIKISESLQKTQNENIDQITKIALRNGVQNGSQEVKCIICQKIRSFLSKSFQISQTNIEFYQNPSFADPSCTLPGLFYQINLVK